VEKNWVLFEDNNSAQKCVYEWSPLTIADIINSTLTNVVKRFDVPSFFSRLRGSTNGVAVGTDIWFICHAVSYEDRRYYYHIVVVMDTIIRYDRILLFGRSKMKRLNTLSE
jgi:hypothetical protein